MWGKGADDRVHAHVSNNLTVNGRITTTTQVAAKVDKENRTMTCAWRKSIQDELEELGHGQGHEHLLRAKRSSGGVGGGVGGAGDDDDGRYWGLIRSDNRDGTYDIDYDDGKKESSVRADLIKSVEGVGRVDRVDRVERVERVESGGSGGFREGEKVEVRYTKVMRVCSPDFMHFL